MTGMNVCGAFNTFILDQMTWDEPRRSLTHVEWPVAPIIMVLPKIHK